MPGVRLLFMQSSGGLTEARRFQGKDAILSGPGGRHRRHGAKRAGGRARAPDRLRHGRNVDGCEPLRRRVRARVRYRGRGRTRARAHDEHSQHRGGRRFDHPFRRRAAARGPGIGGRQSGSRELSARRPARRSPMRTCCSGESSRRSFRKSSGTHANQALDRRRRARSASPNWPGTDVGAAPAAIQRRRGGCRRAQDRGRQHGQCREAHLRGARLRRHALHAAVLRRRGRPACVSGRGRARNGARLLPPAGRRAVCLRHGSGRSDRDARGGARAGARRRGRGSRRAHSPRAWQRGAARSSSFKGSRRSACAASLACYVRYQGTDTALPCELLPADRGGRFGRPRFARSSSAPIAGASRF